MNERGPVTAEIPISAYEASLNPRRRLSMEEIAYQVEQRHEASKRSYAIEHQYFWPRNHHMVYGRQWIDWNPLLRKFIQRPNYRDRTVTMNHLRGRMEARVAKLTSSRPNFSALPASDDLSAKRAAMLSEKILEHDWHALKMYLARYLAAINESIFGMGIIKTVYNKDGGTVRADYSKYIGYDGNPLNEEQLKMAKESGERIHPEWVHDGEFRVESIHPSQLHPPPGIMYPIKELCPWLIHEYSMSREDIKKDFGVELQGDSDRDSTGFNESIAMDIHRFTYQQWMSESNRRGKVRVLEYYERPSTHRNYERGRVFIVAEGKVLNKIEDEEKDGYPGERSQFYDGRYPFFFFPSLPEPGKFWPRAWISDQVDPQVSYNQTRARMRLWEALMFSPYILNPNTSGIPESHFSGGNKILTYQPQGGRPEFWVPPPVPSEAYRSLSRDLEDLDMIGREFGFSRGQQQQGSPSAALAQLMIESDQSELGPILSMHARSWEDLGHAVLELRRRYGSEKELIRMVGERGMPELREFKSKDIPSNLLIKVQEDSLQPQIKAVRIETARSLVREGFYGNPNDLSPKIRQKLLENMGQPVGRFGVDDPEMAERAYIKLENYLLIEGGKEVATRPGIDNDENHINGHIDRCNEADAMGWDTKTVGRMRKHIDEHRQIIAKAQEDAQMQQLDMAQKMKMIEVEGSIREEMFKKASDDFAGEDAGKKKEPEGKINNGGKK